MRSLAALVALVLLSGCISIGGSTKEDAKVSIYTLQPPTAAASSARGGVTVAIARPELPSGLAGERIALSFNGGAQQDYYADAKWSARLEDLMQDFMLRAARHDLRGIMVLEPDKPANYRIDVKVGAFGPVYAGAPDTIPDLRVALTATVIALPAGTTRAQFAVQKSAPASANTLTAVTKGLDGLLQAASEEAFTKAAASLKPASG